MVGRNSHLSRRSYPHRMGDWTTCTPTLEFIVPCTKELAEKNITCNLNRGLVCGTAGTCVCNETRDTTVPTHIVNVKRMQCAADSLVAWTTNNLPHGDITFFLTLKSSIVLKRNLVNAVASRVTPWTPRAIVLGATALVALPILTVTETTD